MNFIKLVGNKKRVKTDQCFHPEQRGYKYNIMRILSFDKTKSSISARDLVEKISEKVPTSVQVQVLKDTYPQGRIRGTQFMLGSLRGESGNSLKIDITPGPHFMKGTDFNGGEGVGGIAKILMEGKGMSLPEVKEYFSDYLGEDRTIVRG